MTEQTNVAEPQGSQADEPPSETGGGTWQAYRHHIGQYEHQAWEEIRAKYHGPISIDTTTARKFQLPKSAECELDPTAEVCSATEAGKPWLAFTIITAGFASAAIAGLVLWFAGSWIAPAGSAAAIRISVGMPMIAIAILTVTAMIERSAMVHMSLGLTVGVSTLYALGNVAVDQLSQGIPWPYASTLQIMIVTALLSMVAGLGCLIAGIVADLWS